MRAFVFVTLLWGLATTAACDGASLPPVNGVGRFPSSSGEPWSACDAKVACAPGWGCVVSAGSWGHCVPMGTAGGPCVADVAGKVCDIGLVCEGKGDTCVPMALAGASCAGVGCNPPFVCDDSVGDPTCVAPGTQSGACRAISPLCDQGLGCANQRCLPLNAKGLCFSQGSTWPCPEGRLCSHFPGDPGDLRGQCLPPSVPGGACGDPALGRPSCEPGAGCVDGVCRTDAIPPGGACLAAAPNVRCEDASACLRDVCITLGTQAAPCRSTPSQACDEGLACRNKVCTQFIPDGEACEPIEGASLFCNQGSSCMQGPDGYACVGNGQLGGSCEGSCLAPLVCARGKDKRSVCQAPMPEGSRCSFAREPFEPCETAASCSLQTRLCTLDGALGTNCDASGACAVGLWCVSSTQGARCYPAPPEVPVGSACDVNPDQQKRSNRCQSALTCVDVICTAPGALGASCRLLGAQPRCDEGLSCELDVCRPGMPVGSPCLLGGDSECAAPALCVQGAQTGECRIVRGYTLREADATTLGDACKAGGVALAFSSSSGFHPRDEGATQIGLPFPFVFWGDPNKELWVSVNGVAGFPPTGSILNPGLGGTGALPALAQPALVAPFWDDLTLGRAKDSQVCAKLTGVAPNQRFTITWKGLSRFAHPSTSLTFSLMLHEATGVIEFAYDDLFAPPGDQAFVSGVRAAIGLQSTGGFVHLQREVTALRRRNLTFVPNP